MEKSARKKLKHFLDTNIPFYELKAEGFFQGIRKTDYEKIAEKICYYFGYKSIYEYGKLCNGKRCNGKCKEPTEYCKSYGVLKWKKLEINYLDVISQDSWLN